MDDTSLRALQLAGTMAVNVGLAVLVGSLASLWALPASACAWAARRAFAVARVFRLATFWSLAATAFLLWTQVAVMTELPFLGAAAGAGAVLMQTHFGHAWIVGSAALVASTAIALSQRGRPAGAGPLAASIGCVAVFAGSRSSAGHAGATGALLPWLVDWAHLLFVSVWAGTVFVAAGIVLRSAPNADISERDACARYVETLSGTAAWSLAGVVATGTFNAWRGLGGALGPLISSSYGIVLLAKLALVAVAAAMGAHNRFVAMPRLLGSLRAPQQGYVAPLRRFNRVLRLESFVLFAVLVAAAVLSTSAPVSMP